MRKGMELKVHLAEPLLTFSVQTLESKISLPEFGVECFNTFSTWTRLMVKQSYLIGVIIITGDV